MGGDFRKSDNSPLDNIKNLANKSFTAKMEKAFATLQELIILKMEANECKLLMPKNQFLEIMMNAGFVLNPDGDGNFNLAKQIQFIIDREIKVYTLYHDDNDGEVKEYDMEDPNRFGTKYVTKNNRQIVLRW